MTECPGNRSAKRCHVNEPTQEKRHIGFVEAARIRIDQFESINELELLNQPKPINEIDQLLDPISDQCRMFVTLRLNRIFMDTLNNVRKEMFHIYHECAKLQYQIHDHIWFESIRIDFPLISVHIS